MRLSSAGPVLTVITRPRSPGKTSNHWYAEPASATTTSSGWPPAAETRMTAPLRIE